MKKQNKKAFTLVELLVVIAILAILATVSIVGYSAFTKKAKQSVAMQEIAQVVNELRAIRAVQGLDVNIEGVVYENNGFYFDADLNATDEPKNMIKTQLEGNTSIYQEHGATVYGKDEAATKLNGRGVTAGNPTVAIAVDSTTTGYVSLVLYKDGAEFYESSATLNSAWKKGNFIVSLYDVNGIYQENDGGKPWKIKPASLEAASGYYFYELTLGDKKHEGFFYYNGK